MPSSPMIVSAWRLLGSSRVRRSWTGKVVLQVLEGRRRGYMHPSGARFDESVEKRWRDASIYDLETMNGCVARDEEALLPPVTPRPR